MSELMLLGILRMPHPDANDVILSQFIAAAREAADQLQQLQHAVDTFRCEGMGNHAAGQCGDLCPWCEVDRLSRSVRDLEAENQKLHLENRRLRDLTHRALRIIMDAIVHGMPVTKEVTNVRNEICGVKHE
jgi:hypothetical protein